MLNTYLLHAYVNSDVTGTFTTLVMLNGLHENSSSIHSEIMFTIISFLRKMKVETFFTNKSGGRAIFSTKVVIYFGTQK